MSKVELRFHRDPRRVADVATAIIDGVEHERVLYERDEKDARDLRIAHGYLRHRKSVTGLIEIDRERGRSDATSDGRLQLAADVDLCLAIETLFPELRERLPA